MGDGGYSSYTSLDSSKYRFSHCIILCPSIYNFKLGDNYPDTWGYRPTDTILK
jgi:hypothetical protein